MKITALGIVLTLLLLPITTVCQVLIGPAGVYAQNFAFLGTTDYSLTNNTGLNLGWYATRTSGNATPNIFEAEAGLDPTAGFNNYGTAGNADRALGALAGPSTDTVFYGLRIQNDTGATASGIRIQYTGEQWRDSTTTPQTLAFSYQTSATGVDILDLTSGTYTNFAALDFVSPANNNPAGAAAAIDGNLGTNRTVFDQTINVSIAAGGEIMLRWSDVNDTGLDHGLSIDDVFITLLVPTAAGISVSGRAMTAGGMGISGAVLVLSGGTLDQPRTARTNSFGYYTFNDVPAGSTYLLEISAKRYTFDQASQVIQGQDNVSGVDFISGSK